MRLSEIQVLAEKREEWSVAPLGKGSAKTVPVLVNPSSGELRAFLRGREPDVVVARGCFFPSDGLNVIVDAYHAVHMEIERHLDREDEAHDIGEISPYSGRYYLAVSLDGLPVFIGNPEVVFAELPNAARLFPFIDLPTGSKTKYQPSEWGVPAREWDHMVG